MPNWVFNTLAVSGDHDILATLRAQLNKPFENRFPKMELIEGDWVNVPDTQYYSNPVFSFWNVIAPTDLDTYYGGEKKEVTDTEKAFSVIEKIRHDFATKNDWYNWNVRNWGTKWDIAVMDNNEYPDTTVEITEDGSLLYHFNTAWSPVMEILNRLTQMYPSLEFDYEYEEEQGWGGKIVVKAGKVLSHTEWDIPSTHADYIEQGKECVCGYEDDPQYWLADCPADTSKYELVDDSWVEKEGVGA